MLTGAQMRMARGYLRWSVKDLSDACEVSSATIKRMEEADGVPQVLTANLSKVAAALQAKGVTLLPDDGDGIGIRCRGAQS